MNPRLGASMEGYNKQGITAITAINWINRSVSSNCTSLLIAGLT